MTDKLDFDAALVRKYDVRGPRYTSYPTAAQFSRSFDEQSYRAAAERAGRSTGPLSLYVHIPFCRTVCFYCGCNKIITANYSKAQSYLRWLSREMQLVAPLFAGRPVTQLHFGGGTPTYLRDEDMRALMDELRRHFALSEGEREFSIEIDPRAVSPETIAMLAEEGFNRVSLGVQDFDPEVQRAVNRIQPVELTAAAVAAARRHGFRSTSFDLIYGLPRQTVGSFERTLDTVIEMMPDRLAIYGYAHLPELFKLQRKIDAAELPSADERLRLLELSISKLTQAGYVYIGMDHFALPQDELAVARTNGSLHRNFQGYSTHADCDLVALGVSAISAFGASYAQNAKDLSIYAARLEAGRLATFQGLALGAEDLLRRDVIQAIMCRGRVGFEDIERAHGIRFTAHFAPEIEALEPLREDGLVAMSGTAIEATAKGRLFLRNIAMVFDEHLPRAAQRPFSRVI